jgi:hypothetical protein
MTFLMTGSVDKRDQKSLPILVRTLLILSSHVLDYIHTGTITASDVADRLLAELEDWIAYHSQMTTAADAIRSALTERVSDT